MNKTFRSVWNASKQAYVAAAETVSAKGKPSSGIQVAAIVAGLMGSLLGSVAHAQTAPPATALPTGGQVSAGQASITQNGAHMVINQSSNRAAINWQTFNVGSGAHVQFVQPSSQSVALNRVQSANPSQIFGRISANGQVILTNPSGVYFSPSSRVDVGGLMATTHSITDANFMAGNLRFERSGSTASVVNEGELKAALGGYIALLAPEVRNQGAVIAHMGTVALASGEAVDLSFDSNNRLTSLRVEASQIQALVDNQHAVQAPGGLVIISAQSMDRLVGGVVKNSGAIEATGLQQQNGRIVLSGSTKAENSGSLNVSNAQGPGGSVSLQGEHIELKAGSRIDATGSSGGGTVLVGGNWQGSADPLLQATGQPTQQATTVTMAAGASIDASATQNGNGGTVVLWSDLSKPEGLTLAQGAVAAKGGALGGDGGRVETSGPSIDIDSFSVDTRSASPSSGKTGLWLIDPYDYTINASQASSIVSALNSSNVEVTTANNVGSYGSNGNSASGGGIRINSNINSNSANSLTLKTHTGIIQAAGVSVSTNGGSVTYWTDSDNNASGSIYFEGAATISTNGGHITLAGGADSGGSPGGYSAQIYAGGQFTANSNGGNILLRSRSEGNFYSTAFLAAANFDSGSGSITMDAQQTGSTIGLLFATSVIMTSSKNSGTAIALSGGANSSYGVVFNADPGVVSTVKSTGAGAITINGSSSNPSNGAIAGIYLFADVLSGSGAITLNGGAAGITLSSSGASLLGQKAGQVNASSSNISLVADRVVSSAATTGLSIVSSGQASITSSAASFSSAFDLTSKFTLSSSLTGLTVGSANNASHFTLSTPVSIAGPITLNAADITLNSGLTATGTNTVTLKASGNVTDGASGFLSADKLLLNGGNVTLDSASNDVNTLAASGVSNLTYVDSNALTVGVVTATGISATGAVSLTGGNVTVGANVTTTASTGTGVSITGTSIKHNSGITVSTSGANIAYSVSNSPFTSGNDVAIDLNQAGGTGATINAGGGNIDINASFASLGVAGTGSSDMAIGARNFSILTSGNGSINIHGDASNNTGTGLLRGFSLFDAKVISSAGAINITGTGGKATTQSSGVYLDWKSSVLSASGAITLTDQKAAGMTGVHAGMLIAGGATINRTFLGANGVDVANSSSPITLRTDALSVLNVNANISSSGTFTLEPVGTTFSSPADIGATFSSNLGSVTIGKSTNTANITVSNAINSTGNIALTGGNITLNAGLTTTGTNTITLKGTGNVTDGANGFVNATNLLLTGGNVTLDSASNAIGTLAASGVSNLTYVDSNALTVGTVGSTAGINGTGTLDITGTNVTLAANLATAATSGAGIAVRGNKITQNDNISAISQGGNIVYSVVDAAFTSGADFSLILSNGSLIRANGGNVNISASYAATGVAGGSDRVIAATDGSTTIETSGSGTISVTADGTNNTSTGNVWGMQLGATIKTVNGAINITGIGGKATNGSRGIASTANLLRILSATGTITIRDEVPVGFSGTSFAGLYLQPTTGSNILIGSDGTGTGTWGTSSSNITFQSDKITFDVNNTYKTRLATSGNVVIESIGSSFLSAFDTSNVLMTGNPSGVRLGKNGNTADLTVANAITAAGPVEIYGGAVAVNAGLTTTNTTTGDVTFNAATVTGSSNIALAGGRALSVTQSANSTYSGIVSGTGSTLTKLGAGTLTLTGANSHTGATTITAGTLAVGSGSTTGALGSGAVVNNAALTFNRSNDLTVGGDISGTGTLTQLGAGTLTLTGANSYSGTTTITAGTLQVGSGGTTGSLGSGAVTNDAALTFNRSNNLTVVVNISGTGTLTKLGAGITTLSGVSSYTGATTITSGGLVFSNNTRPSTTGFTGGGQLTIEPSTSFSAAFNTNSYTYANTLTSLTFGKSGNTADINVGNPIAISGPISMEGGNIALNGNLTSTLAGAAIWAKATGNITSNASRTFQTNNGHLTLWADSDANGTGSIAIGDNNTLNSANGSTSSGLSGGGNITLAGGNDTNTDGIPDGHAASSTLSGISLGTSTANSTSMYSGGGDVIVRGRSTTIISGDVLNRAGVFQWGSMLVDAGQGAVNFDGNSSTFFGISFVKPVNNTTAGAKHLQIISAKTSGEAISITGTSAATHGVVFDFSNPKEILATGGGGISITGSGAGSVNAIFLSNIDILATSGNIVLNGGSRGITVSSGSSATLGKKAGTGITTSTSNITLTGDQFSINSPTTVDTTGTLTVQPSSTSFSSSLTWPMGNLTIASGLTGLTLGKSGNTADITIGSATSIAGPINVFAGALNINASLTTTNATTGNVTFNAATLNGSGNISLANGRALSVTQSGNSTYSGIVSGTDSTLTKLGAGTLTLTGANSYTGATTITTGILQVGSGSTTGTLGSGAVTNNAALSFNRSNALTVVGNISGTGTLTNLGAGTTTLTGVSSYTGNTTITSGGLVFSNNTRPSTPGFTGAGQLTIAPSTSFSAAFNTNSYTYATTLTGLTFGKSGNTANITVGSPITISGPISLEGGVINIIANLTSTGAISAKASGNITQEAGVSITSSGGNVTYWADSDDNATGAITFGGQASITTNGGKLTLAGGADSGSGSPNGYAVQILGANTGDLSFSTAGGDVLLKGKNTVGSGIRIYAGLSVNAGSGNISIDGQSAASGFFGVGLDGATTLTTTGGAVLIEGESTGSSGIRATSNLTIDSGTGSITLNGQTTASGSFGIQINGATSLTSSKVSGTAISLNGTSASSRGIVLETTSSTTSNLMVFKSTGGGGISLNSSGTQAMWLDNVRVLAASGNITVSSPAGFTAENNANATTVFGRQAGLLDSSSSNITITTNVLNNLGSPWTGNLTVDTSGQVTLKPSSTSFSSAVGTERITWGSSITGLTLGQSGNTANINIGAININGPISVEGGTLNLGGDITTTNTTTGDITLNAATVTGSGNIALASGRALSVTHSGNSTYSGIVSGTNSTLTKLGAGTLTLTGANSYTGITTITAGTLQVGDGSTTGALGSGAVTNDAALTFNRSNNLTVVANISGTGTLTNLGAGITTLSGVSSYTGATTITSGGLVFSNNTRPSTTGFTGAGQLTIEPSTSFSAAFNTNSYTYATTLTSLTFGKSGNISNIIVGNPISINGPISVYGGNITVNSALTTTSGSSGSVLLKATGGIIDSASIITNGGDITLWSNSATNTTTGSSVGGININDNVVLDSRTAADRTASTHTLGGGAITLGGGSETTTTANGSTVPSSYAMNASPESGLILGTNPVSHASNIQINSGGGHISLRGRTNQNLGNIVGISAYEGYKINAGTTGNITLTGLADAGTSLPQAGMDLQMYRNGTVAASTSATAASFITTVNGNIVVTGITNSSHTSSNGVQAGGSAVASALTLQATGTGSITINGSSQTLGSSRGDIWLHANVNLLAASGNITLNGTGLGGVLFGGVNIGRLSGSAVNTSSSNITINTNWLTPFNSVSNLRTSGAVTVQSVGNNFASTLNFPDSLMALSSDVSALTLGKNIGSTAHTDTVNLGAATSIAGPIQVYSGNITVNGALTTTSGSNGTVLLKATSGITSSASITTNGADITLWSNATTNTTTGTSVGGIQINNNVVLDSRTAVDRTASTHTLGGGAITLGGGSVTTTTANGNTVPDGYAMNYSTTESGLILGTNAYAATTHVSNIQINSGGGHIYLSGRSNQAYQSTTLGVSIYEGLKVNAGTTGNITLTGLANHAVVSTGQAGIDMQAWRNGTHAASISAAAATSFTTANGAIVLTGNTNGTLANGLQLAGAAAASAVTVQATGTGSVTLNGSSQLANGAAGDLYLSNVNFLAASGNITLNANGLGAVVMNAVNFGRLSGSSVSASSSNITLNTNSLTPFSSVNNFRTSGTVTVQSVGNNFTAALSFPGSLISLSNDISGLTLGKDIGSTAHTDTVTVDGATSIAGPITIYAGTIGINQSLAATGGNTITLKGSSVTDGASGSVSADKLLLLSGNVTLNSSSNAIGTLAASGVGALTYVDSNALSIGTVDATNGVSATGAVSIATLTGDLTVSQNVATTNATASALTLNAGQSAAAGTSTGGNLLLSGTPSLSVGTGGVTKLYSGSIADSPGLIDLVGSGSGKFRYNADETTNFASGNWTNLGTSGTYAIYREQPTATTSSMTLSMVYGDALPTVTATGMVNGDTSGYSIASRLNSSNGIIRANATPYNITSSLLGLGYGLTGSSTGTLTVNAKAITVSSLSSADKVYDGTTSATASGTASLLASVALGSGTNADGKAYIGDTVNLSGSVVGTFNTQDVATATTVSFSGLTLAGADATNYSLTQPTSVSASITPKTVSLSASKTYDGTTDLSAAVTLTTGVGSETLSYSAATASDAHVATVNKYISAITLGNATDNSGGVASNYQLPTLNASNAPVTINAATLTPTLTNTGVTKVYDGSTNAPSGFAPSYSFIGLVSGDTDASLSSTSISYNNANVASATGLTVSGLTISSVTGNRGSQASDYVLNANSKSVSAVITKAPLTVTANNDAKFVTQSDAMGFAGAGYSGFVNGEDVSALGGALSVTRTNSSTSTAGVYNNVLVPSGLTSDNYTISYAPGQYSIIGSNQLLVRVADVSSTYGTAVQYGVSSVEYYNGSNVVRLHDGSVANSSVTLSGAQLSVNDGANGTATMSLVPTAAAYSNAGKLVTGSYQLGATGVSTVNSANFGNTINVVGSHQVSSKALTVSTAGVSKVYNGLVDMPALTLSLGGAETNDGVNVSGVGAFTSKNVGNPRNYTVSNLALTGADAGNYHLAGGNTYSGTNGVITARPITVNYSAANKVYDGSATASVSSTDNRVSADALTVSQVATFADKNVGASKTVTVSGVTLGGADAGNYSLTSSTASMTADITRLGSVAWVGGTTGNWFDPANWANGAVPDLANVSNVVIPVGVNVSFDKTGAQSPVDTSGVVNLDSLGTQGSLTQANGALHIGSGGLALNSYTQNGGTLTNAGTTTLGSLTQSAGSFSGTGAMAVGNLMQSGGTLVANANLTVSNDFQQSGNGQISVGGNATITDTQGGLQLGNLTSAGPLSVTSTDGAISQATGTSISAQSTSQFSASTGSNPPLPADIILSNAGNDFMGAVSVSGQNIALTDANALSLGTVNAAGALTLNSTGTLDLGTSTVGGNLVANSGNGNITQTGALSVGGTTDLNAGAGGIVLSNAANDFAGAVSATGQDIALTDANALTLGTVTAAGSLTLNSNGALDLGTSTVGGDLVANSGNGNITQTGALIVEGSSRFDAGTGNVTLRNAGNDLVRGVFAQATTIDIVGDRLRLAAELNAINNGVKLGQRAYLFRVESSTQQQDLMSQSAQLPAALSLQKMADIGTTRQTQEAQPSSSTTAATSTQALQIDVIEQPTANIAFTVNVILPKEMLAAGQALRFELPESVKTQLQPTSNIQVSQVNGGTLPTWLNFVPTDLRFEAQSLPSAELPLQVMLMNGQTRVMVVLSAKQD